MSIQHWNHLVINKYPAICFGNFEKGRLFLETLSRITVSFHTERKKKKKLTKTVTLSTDLKKKFNWAWRTGLSYTKKSTFLHLLSGICWNCSMLKLCWQTFNYDQFLNPHHISLPQLSLLLSSFGSRRPPFPNSPSRTMPPWPGRNHVFSGNTK